MAFRKQVESKQCQTHEINYLATLPGCPYCRTAQIEADEKEAALHAEAQGAKKEKRGTRRTGLGSAGRLA